MAKVLVIDDQAGLRGVVRAYLEAVLGCAVVEAESGIEGVLKLLAEPFDLVVTDLVMPEMSGLEVVAFVKRAPSLAAIPVIMLTSHGNEKDRDRARKLGAERCLSKPFDPATMGAAIKELLGP